MEAGALGALPPMQIWAASSLRQSCVISLRQGHVWPASPKGVVALLSPTMSCAPLMASGSLWRLCFGAPRPLSGKVGARPRPRAGRDAREFSPGVWTGEVTGEVFTVTSQDCDGARLRDLKHGVLTARGPSCAPQECGHGFPRGLSGAASKGWRVGELHTCAPSLQVSGFPAEDSCGF